mmetsp:Transcript_13141/g.44493  ORF Transcript_13141/g.44493 Transcript_13141/m.44493 type:complete len:253 (-) Transcript_13141:25-783(-)
MEAHAGEGGLGESHVVGALAIGLVEGAVGAHALGLARAPRQERLATLAVPRVARVVHAVRGLAAKVGLAHVVHVRGAVGPGLLLLEGGEEGGLLGLVLCAHLRRLALKRLAGAVHVDHLVLDALPPLLRWKVLRELVTLEGVRRKEALLALIPWLRLEVHGTVFVLVALVERLELPVEEGVRRGGAHQPGVRPLHPKLLAAVPRVRVGLLAVGIPDGVVGRGGEDAEDGPLGQKAVVHRPRAIRGRRERGGA